VVRTLVVWIAISCALRGVAAQCQVAQLLAPDAAAVDLLGQDVAIDGDWAFVGRPGDDELAAESGAVDVFRRGGAGWAHHQKLKASDAGFGDAFGFALALQGSTALVAAPHHSPGGVFDAGSVYVFELAGSVWSETQRLSAADAAPTAHFGFSVALDGARCIAGAKDDSGAGPSSGSAYVFERVAGSFVESAKLTAVDAATGDAFGRSVDIEGDTLIVGAPGANVGVGSDHGAAYVFDFVGAWTQADKLTANDAAPGDSFGWAVALEGARALVTATGHDHAASNAGAAFAFERVFNAWTQTGELHAPDAVIGDAFGASACIDGALALVGATADDDLGFSSGCAWILRHDGSAWQPIGKLLALDGRLGDALGVSVALSSDTAVAGAVFRDDACPTNSSCDSGAAYVFDLVPQARQYGSCATSAPCGNVDAHGGCANSTGVGGVLVACGSASVAADDLALMATSLPPSAAAVALVGALTTQVPLGAGLRVVAGGASGIVRMGLGHASPEGLFLHGPGVVAQLASLPLASQIQVGSTRYFQVWYRDASGPCGQTTNLTSGLEVVFLP
jgi:hypothetical protein